MGFFSSIGHAFSSAVRGVCNFVGGICSSISGALGGGVLGEAVKTFVTAIGVVFPALDIVSTVLMIANVVCKIAEVLGIKKEGQDNPEEIAMKAEKDDKKPEDFDSVEDYIRHLQEDIQLTKDEKEKLNNMSAEEKTAYKATGTYLYTKACNEKLGFDKTGLGNPELVGLTAEVLADLSKIMDILSPSDFVVYSKSLQSNGLGMKEFSDYLHNRSTNLDTDEKVQSALVDAMKELSPNISDDEINKKLYEMNIED